MRSVGIKVLKNKLSEYVRLAAGGETVLVFGSRKVRIGTHLTVSVGGQDYDLELVRIDRTTYTLRLNREEITRPITKGKSP